VVPAQEDVAKNPERACRYVQSHEPADAHLLAS
jgi:hypothetical protein